MMRVNVILLKGRQDDSCRLGGGSCQRSTLRRPHPYLPVPSPPGDRSTHRRVRRLYRGRWVDADRQGDVRGVHIRAVRLSDRPDHNAIRHDRHKAEGDVAQWPCGQKAN